MNKKQWTKKEIDFLKDNHQNKTCSEIAKILNRTTKSIYHKYNQLKLEKRKAKIGDVVNGWLIIEIFNIHNGQQNVSHAKIISTINDKEKIVRLSLLTNKQIGYPALKRPDVIQRNTTHNMSKTRIYTIWNGMLSRCKTNPTYVNKKIQVCKEWHIFENFLDWADLSGYSDTLSIDRVDNSKDYSPENCRWATKQQQIINKDSTAKLNITAFGETKHFTEWANDKRCAVSTPTLKSRILSGWNPEDSISIPSQRQVKKNLKNWLKEKYPDIYNEYIAI